MDRSRRGNGPDLPELTEKRDFRVAPYKSWLKIHGNDPVPVGSYMELTGYRGVFFGKLMVGKNWTYQIRIPTSALRRVSERKVRLLKQHLSAVLGTRLLRLDGEALAIIFSNNVIWLQDKAIRRNASAVEAKHFDSVYTVAHSLFNTICNFLRRYGSRKNRAKVLGAKLDQQLAELRQRRPKLNPLSNTEPVTMKIVDPGDVLVVNQCHISQSFGPLHLGERLIVVTGSFIGPGKVIQVRKETDPGWVGSIESDQVFRVRK